MEEEFESEEQETPDSPFYIEVDLFETGDHSRLIVVPCNDSFVVINNDEHLCTLVHTCKEVECWEQEDGALDEELVERIGMAIKQYTPY
jgi:hypothetical protein